VQPQDLDAAGKAPVGFDPVEDVERSVQVVLVLAKVEVNGVEDEAEGDVAVECGDEEPVAEVDAGDVGCDAVPYFWGRAVRRRRVCETNLGAERA
jgi:hypothetical protein